MPLHLAAERDFLEIVRLLLDHGADIDAKARMHGWTAAHCAAFQGATNVMRLLLEKKRT